MDRQSEIRLVQQMVGGLGPRPAISQILTPRLSLPPEEFALEDAIIIIADRESMAGHTIAAGTSGKIKQVHGEYVQVDFDGHPELRQIDRADCSSLRRIVDVERGHLSLDEIRSDPSRESGHRQVFGSGILQKLKDLWAAKAIRSHDVIMACTLPEQPGRWKPAYVKFHHRACALHAVAGFFYLRQRSLPTWLQNFKQIPSEYYGALTTGEMMAQGLAKSACLEYGRVGVNWLGTVLAVQERGAAFGETVAGCLQLLAPPFQRARFTRTECSAQIFHGSFDFFLNRHGCGEGERAHNLQSQLASFTADLSWECVARDHQIGRSLR